MNQLNREQPPPQNMNLPSVLSYSSSSTLTTVDGLLPNGKKLVGPLVVHIEKDDGEVLVSEPRFSMHASAPTLSEAIAEFKRILADELEELTRDEEQLGPRLQAQLQYLRTY
jgi:hypothetical protein